MSDQGRLEEILQFLQRQRSIQAKQGNKGEDVALRLPLAKVGADAWGKGNRHPEAGGIVLVGVLLLVQAEDHHRQVVELVDGSQPVKIFHQLFLFRLVGWWVGWGVGWLFVCRI